MENLFQEMENCTVHTPETSWDYYEMAEDAETEEEALKFARKALELDPDNIDAKVMVAEMETEHPHEMLKKYEELIEYDHRDKTFYAPLQQLSGIADRLWHDAQSGGYRERNDPVQ